MSEVGLLDTPGVAVLISARMQPGMADFHTNRVRPVIFASFGLASINFQFVQSIRPVHPQLSILPDVGMGSAKSGISSTVPRAR